MILEKRPRTIRPGILPKKPRLSVCMIVLDEEKMLPRCLKSVESVADELIVVDTGSKDNTISIAKDFGAKVYYFKWRDDFAAARNESLKHATGDWILQMDADEELLANSILPLKRAMSNPWCLVYVIKCDCGPRCRSQRFGWMGRLFRNHLGLQYSRPYHEMVNDSADKLISKEPRWQIMYEPNIVIRHYGYEQFEMLKKRGERGLRIMEAYIEKNSDDVYMLSKLGGVYCDLGRYKDAERYLRKALEINPNWIETNYYLGVTLHRQGKLDVAIELYKKVIAIDPRFVEAYTQLGTAYREKGMVDEVILVLKKALAINPDLTLAHSDLGLAYNTKGMLDESIAELKKAVAIDRDLAQAHMNLGVAYAKKGMLDEAIAEHKEAIGINPDLSMGYTHLGAAYHMKGMFDEAMARYKRALKIDANNADAHFNLGVAYRDKGMINEAIAEYKRAVAINPYLAEAHNNLAVAYYVKKQYGLAIKHCDKAIKLGFKVHPGFLQDLKTYR